MLTSEYSTGSMRTSLTVMPRRTVFYGAKLAVFAAISLGVALVTSFGAFFLGQALRVVIAEDAAIMRDGLTQTLTRRGSTWWPR